MPIPINGGGRNDIERVAGYIYKVAAEIKSVWSVVSEWPWPFNMPTWYLYWAWAWVDLVGDNVLSFAHGYLSVTDVLSDMWGLLRLDEWDLWFRNEWRQFLTNPIAYITGVIGDLIHNFAILTTWPGRWILETLDDHRPEIYALLDNFPKAFTRWAQDNHLWLYNLLFDKEALLTDVLDKFSWEVAYFARDPKHAFQLFSSLWLELPIGFWADPAEGIVIWVFDSLLNHWRRIAKSAVNVAENILIESW